MRALLPLLLAGCLEPLELAPRDTPEPLDPGDARTVVLLHRELEVAGFEQRIDLDRLKRVPAPVLDGIWLLDLPVEGLVGNALQDLRDLTLVEARDLPVPAQNMRRLLRTTPDNADLTGTSLEELVSVSAALGIPPARALGELLEVAPTAEVVDRELTTEVFVDLLIGTHPNARWRSGPVDDDHPDGRWPVAPGAIPITLGDLVRSFSTMAETFGPVGDHPGFVEAADGVSVLEDDFRMVAKVDAQALPRAGVDLDRAAVGAVSTIASQIDGLFPVDDPDWLRIEGLSEDPTIARLTLAVSEDDLFHAAGTARTEDARGDGTAWSLDPWVLEHLLAEQGHRLAAGVSPHCVTFTLGTGAVAFEGCVAEDGWATFETFDGVGNPPAPAFLGDLIAELGQTRLHDGNLPEGEADLAMTLSDVSLGIAPATIIEEARANLAQRPDALRELARVLTENSRGEVDVMYVRGPEDPEHPDHGDWLWFLHPDDLPLGEDGGPVRPYAYARPGFFADEGLTQPMSDTREALGDAVHEKVRVSEGEVLFVEDDGGRVFRIDVGGKPSRSRVALEITRVR